MPVRPDTSTSHEICRSKERCAISPNIPQCVANSSQNDWGRAPKMSESLRRLFCADRASLFAFAKSLRRSPRRHRSEFSMCVNTQAMIASVSFERNSWFGAVNPIVISYSGKWREIIFDVSCRKTWNASCASCSAKACAPPAPASCHGGSAVRKPRVRELP